MNRYRYRIFFTFIQIFITEVFERFNFFATFWPFFAEHTFLITFDVKKNSEFEPIFESTIFFKKVTEFALDSDAKLSL